MAAGRMIAKGRFVESQMRKPIEAWRNRAPKQDADVRCCWVCGGIGGNGFTTSLRLAGYRMAPGEVGYAHTDCMRKAQLEAMKRQRGDQ
jgi:hypothetical protein